MDVIFGLDRSGSDMKNAIVNRVYHKATSNSYTDLIKKVHIRYMFSLNFPKKHKTTTL